MQNAYLGSVALNFFIMKYFLFKIMFFISICFIMISCSSLVMKKLGLDSDEVLVKSLNYDEKDVVFVGIRHIGQEDYYLNTKKIIDSLLNEDYHFILEGNYLQRSDKPPMDKNDSLYLKKFRKIIGLDPTLEFSEQKLFEDFFESHNLKDQPDYTYFNLDYSNSENVDLQYKEIIDIFEAEHGEVVLSSCDNKTSLGQEYNCNKLSKNKAIYLKEKILLEERNKLIINKLKKSKHNKVVILYGEEHFNGIEEQI